MEEIVLVLKIERLQKEIEELTEIKNSWIDGCYDLNDKIKKLEKENEQLKYVSKVNERLVKQNDNFLHDLKLSVNAQSLVNRLLQEMFSAECYSKEFNGQQVTNLLCLGNVCDILEEMCDYRR